MIRLWPILPEWDAKLILQVHDELIFECPEDRAEDFKTIVKKIMEQSPTPDWDIPIVAEVKTGNTYSEAK